MSLARKNAIFLLSSNVIMAFLQIIQLSIISRKLPLEQLGIIAIINTVLSVAMILQDMGMSSFIIHKQNISIREQSTVYWVNVLLSWLSGLLVFLSSFIVAFYFKTPELEGLIMLSSLNFFVLGSLSQYQANYIKFKKINYLSAIEVSSKFLSLLTVIFLLYNTSLGPSVVIYGLFISAISKLFLMFVFGDKSWRPTFQFDKKVCKESLNYGFFQFGSQILNQLRTQIDIVIVGKVLGTEMLGIYSLAKDLIMQPLRLISPVINRIVLPYFAEKQRDISELNELFLSFTKYVLSFSSILFLFIYIFSPLLVSVLYGSGKQYVVTVFQFMIIFGVLRPIGSLTGSIAQANGRTDLEFKWNIAACIVSVLISLTALFNSNIFYVSSLLSLSQVLISVLVYWFFVRNVVSINFGVYLKSWLPGLLFFCFLLYVINKLSIFISLDSFHYFYLSILSYFR